MSRFWRMTVTSTFNFFFLLELSEMIQKSPLNVILILTCLRLGDWRVGPTLLNTGCNCHHAKTNDRTPSDGDVSLTSRREKTTKKKGWRSRDNLLRIPKVNPNAWNDQDTFSIRSCCPHARLEKTSNELGDDRRRAGFSVSLVFFDGLLPEESANGTRSVLQSNRYWKSCSDQQWSCLE
jgi:hypothetical protein